MFHDMVMTVVVQIVQYALYLKALEHDFARKPRHKCKSTVADIKQGMTEVQIYVKIHFILYTCDIDHILKSTIMKFITVSNIFILSKFS